MVLTITNLFDIKRIFFSVFWRTADFTIQDKGVNRWSTFLYTGLEIEYLINGNNAYGLNHHKFGKKRILFSLDYFSGNLTNRNEVDFIL